MTPERLTFDDFAGLTEYDRVIVTGPQRSGTQIVARIIAHETGFRFVPHNSARPSAAGLSVLTRSEQTVMHSPSMVAFLPMVTRRSTAIVFVHRPAQEIRESIVRIRWRNEHMERMYLGLEPQSSDETISVKERRWTVFCECGRIHHPYDVHYHDMEGHALWLPKAARAEFGSTQWQEGGGI